MIYFASARFLFLILLIPFFFLGFWLYRRMMKKKVSKFGNFEMVDKLMPLRSKWKGWVRVIFFSIAWLFFVIGLSRPQIGVRLKENQSKGAEIMIALDVSNSMLAQDYTPNRLERAKLAISRLVDKLQGDRIGLVVFAGQAFVQLPITTDYVSAKFFLKSISTESVPVQGTALGEAINTCIRSFSNEGQQGSNNKAIILITDGENHEDDPVQAAKDAAEFGIKVYTIGVGSPDGKPIPVGSNGELLKDRDGNIVVTKLDENTLGDIALAGNGAYVRAGTSEFGLNPIIKELRQLDEQKFTSVVFEEYDEQYMYFFAIAFIFFIMEFLVGSKRINRKFFAVVVVMFLGTVSLSAQNVVTQRIDKKEVRKGNNLFKKDNFKEADVEYRKGLVLDSTSLVSKYNLGNTLYRLGDFAGAEKLYLDMADSIAKYTPQIPWDTEKGSVSTDVSNYYHNLGNSYLQQKKYQEAVEAYKNSLLRNPSDSETRRNYAYAKKKLEDRQNNQDQNQDKNQDQNQDQNQNQNQDQNKDKDQQNKDQQDKDKEQNKDNKEQDKNKDNNKDNKQDKNKDNGDKNNPQNGQQQPQDAKITPQTAEQMLQAIQDKENATKQKVDKEKAKALKSRQREKNW